MQQLKDAKSLQTAFHSTSYFMYEPSAIPKGLTEAAQTIPMTYETLSGDKVAIMKVVSEE